MPRTEPMNRAQLVRQLAADLAADARAADRHAQPAYAATVRAQFRALFKARRTVRLDRFGWPRLTEFQQPDRVLTARL